MTQIRPPSANRLFRFVVRSPNDIRGDVEDEFAFTSTCASRTS